MQLTKKKVVCGTYKFGMIEIEVIGLYQNLIDRVGVM